MKPFMSLDVRYVRTADEAADATSESELEELRRRLKAIDTVENDSRLVSAYLKVLHIQYM